MLDQVSERSVNTFQVPIRSNGDVELVPPLRLGVPELYVDNPAPRREQVT